MKKPAFLKIAVILAVGLLLPLFSYTAFQVIQNDKNEQLITTLYNRQLESILFSINQYCWDVFGLWQSYLAGLLPLTEPNSSTDLEPGLSNFIARRAAIESAFIRLSATDFALATKPMQPAMAENRIRLSLLAEIRAIVADSAARIDQMYRYAGEGYIRPLVAARSQTASDNPQYFLIFPLFQEKKFPVPLLAGILVNEASFVTQVVGRKFSDISGDEFVGAVVRASDNAIIYGPKGDRMESFEQSKKLWLFPNLDLKIKLKGVTLAQISRGRSRTNLIFLVGVNTLFLLGISLLLRSMLREARLAQLKTDFVANVSHELRTPLALIRMFAETLELGRIGTEEKKHYYYRTIVNESTRLTQLINNILDFSRIESGRKEYQMVPTSLPELVRAVLETYQFHLESKGFRLESEIDDAIPETKVDREALSQVLVNLIDNAVKFSLDDKRIRVTLGQRNNRIVLAVQDYGIGIAKSEQEKIFEKFYRVETSLVHSTKGSGLGLALVKHIMDVHGGQVLVTSKPGQGSTFSLIFPVA